MFRQFHVPVLAAIFTLGLTSAVSAQTISQTSGTGTFPGDVKQGQSFTATVTRTLTQIQG